MKTTKFLSSAFVFALSVIANECDGLNLKEGSLMMVAQDEVLNLHADATITFPSGNWITNYGTINIRIQSTEDEKIKITGDGHGNSGIRNVNGGEIYNDGNRIAPEDYDNYFIFLLGGTIEDEVNGFHSGVGTVPQRQ